MLHYNKKSDGGCVFCNYNVPIAKQKRRLRMCDEKGKPLDKYLEVSEKLYNKILKAVDDSKN